MNRKIYFSCAFYELVSPATKFPSLPGCDGTFIHTQSFIGNDKVAVNAQHLRKAFTSWASAKGIIKIEKIGDGFFKGHSVQFEPVIKMNRSGAIYFNIDVSFTFIKCCS